MAQSTHDSSLESSAAFVFIEDVKENISRFLFGRFVYFPISLQSCAQMVFSLQQRIIKINYIDRTLNCGFVATVAVENLLLNSIIGEKTAMTKENENSVCVEPESW